MLSTETVMSGVVLHFGVVLHDQSDELYLQTEKRRTLLQAAKLHTGCGQTKTISLS